jgi:hypothetical protein
MKPDRPYGPAAYLGVGRQGDGPRGASGGLMSTGTAIIAGLAIFLVSHAASPPEDVKWFETVGIGNL